MNKLSITWQHWRCLAFHMCATLLESELSSCGATTFPIFFLNLPNYAFMRNQWLQKSQWPMFYLLSLALFSSLGNSINTGTLRRTCSKCESRQYIFENMYNKMFQSINILSFLDNWYNLEPSIGSISTVSWLLYLQWSFDGSSSTSHHLVLTDCKNGNRPS